MPPRAGYVLDDQAPLAGLWNAHFRWSGRDMANMLAARVFNQLDGVSTGTARVLGGLSVSAGSGMQSDYIAGAAIHHDATVYTAVLAGEDTSSPFGWQMVEDDGSLTHDAAHATLTRVDLVCILSTIGTDRPESVQQDGGSTTGQDTRWGGQSSVVIVKGTAGSGVPGTPTGYTKLAEASIPALAVAASSFTYTDSRTLVSARVLRGTHYALETASAGDPTLVRIDHDDGDALALQWDTGEHWPRFLRSGAPAGDTLSSLYPMVTPGDRTWWRTVAAVLTLGVGHAASSYTISKGWDPLGDWIGTEFNITGTGDNDDLYMVFPSEGRALTVVGSRFDFDVDTGVGVGTTIKGRLWHYDASAGTSTAISDNTTLVESATGAGVASVALTNVTETGTDVGDLLILVVEIANPSNSGGNVDIRTGSVQFKEGRA